MTQPQQSIFNELDKLTTAMIYNSPWQSDFGKILAAPLVEALHSISNRPSLITHAASIAQRFYKCHITHRSYLGLMPQKGSDTIKLSEVITNLCAPLHQLYNLWFDIGVEQNEVVLMAYTIPAFVTNSTPIFTIYTFAVSDCTIDLKEKTTMRKTTNTYLCSEEL